MRPPFYLWTEPGADHDDLAHDMFVVADHFDRPSVWTIASYADAFSLSRDEAAQELANALVPRGETWVFLD